MPFKRYRLGRAPAMLVVLAFVPTAAANAAADPLDVARDHVNENAADLGVTRADVTDLAVTSRYRSAHSGVTHVNLNQRFRELEVFGGHVTVNVAADGRVIHAGGSLVRGLATSPSGTVELTPTEAVEAAADALGLAKPVDLRVISSSPGPARETVVSGGGVSDQRIPLRVGWQPTRAGLRLAWQLVIDASSDESLWNATVDAETGELLDAEDWTVKDHADDMAATLARPGATAATAAAAPPEPVDDGSSYRALGFPLESPNDGARGLLSNPADGLGSPFGWHDTNAASGPEFTTTQGNNAHAYLDQDDNDAADFGGSPNGGAGLDFDFPADLGEHAQNYREAVVTNLFYANNSFHDLMYRYGFTEAAGNFQANNYGRGGTGGDYVRAEAADGDDINNANFATPVETATSGGTPRMQMFLWPGNQFGSQNQVVVDGLGSFGASWARFSPAPTVAGASGRLVDAGNGCAAADFAGAPSGDWIAIVTGSNAGCQNVQKARQASAAGARALIVALNASGAAPILTGSMTTSPPTIPVASITQADGNAIRAAIAAGPTTGTVRKHPDHPGIRDGDFENGIIIHEYGHGVSTRLTGGPAVNCLTGNEQAGEGWSDFLAIVMLLNPAVDDPSGPRGMGPYALFQPDRQGAGIRPRPYSRNMAIQPFTYDSIKTGGWENGTSLALPHGLGHGWAAVLWDLTWDLIDKHGFNPDVYGAWDTGGNNRALQYVIDGLKMQGCGPGLVAARDAIVAAADELSDGEDTCTVWASFARRGLGYSAVQGTTGRDDNSEAFDTHPECREGFFGGISEPPALNTVNRGDAVELQFDAGGGRGLDILAGNSPYSRQVDCATLRTETPGAQFITPRPVPIAAETPGGAHLSYNRSTGRYTFPWKTLQSWGGTCREFVLTRTDGVQHRAFFRFQANPAYAVTGRVRDADGQPVPNARVTLRGDTFWTTRTDTTGAYSFASVPRGTYEAAASGGGCYEPATQTLDLSRPRTLDFTLARERDAFGYACRLEAAPFEEAGTVVPITGDDVAGTLNLPFAFTFYGFPHTRAHVCTNGFIEFVGPATTNCSASNAAIPTTGRPNGAIYSYWDDTFVDDQASIRTETKGSAPNRRFVIEYRNVHYFEDTSRRVDFNIVLHETGDIVTQYRNIANDGRETGNQATIGIENHTGQDALRFSFNEAVLASGDTVTSLRYTPPPLPPSHTVSGRVRDGDGRPMANATVTIDDTPITPATADADGFYRFERIPAGTYTATAAATGCNSPETKDLVVSGPTTLDFTLPRSRDDFGYTCDLEQASFEEADTVLPITGDAVAGTIDLPFPFTFYGFTHTRAHVCTNGFVEFVGPATTNCSSANAAIPTTTRPNGAVFPFWDNLAVDDQASIRADARGTAPNRRFVIEFRNVLFPPNTSARVDFNVVLHENGQIVTQYRNIDDTAQERGGSATIGIENHTGTDALRVSFNQPGLAPAPAVTSIRYTPPPLPPSHAVTGHVRDEDGRPIPNATVTIEDTPIPPVTTGVDGAYSFPYVPEGTYSATAEAPCNSPVTRELAVSGPTTLDFTLPQRSDAFGDTCALETAAFEEADTVLPLTGDDEAATVDLPFPVTFYGQTYTRAHVCTNGFTEFAGPATTSCPATNVAIPTAARPNGEIASFWDDVVVDAQASIRADTRGTAPNRRFVIEYRNVRFFTDATRRVDFNIVLNEGGEILTQYRNIADDGRERGNSATIGIESHTGTAALLISFNQTVLAPDPAVTSIRYRPPG
jgi:extracellular elastinolytic metalloproteinase